MLYKNTTYFLFICSPGAQAPDCSCDLKWEESNKFQSAKILRWSNCNHGNSCEQKTLDFYLFIIFILQSSLYPVSTELEIENILRPLDTVRYTALENQNIQLTKNICHISLISVNSKRLIPCYWETETLSDICFCTLENSV